MNNKELKQLVLDRLPFRDGRTITLRGYTPDPTTSREFQLKYAPYVDVTKQVKQLLKEGKIKRSRQFGYGHSRKAGNTFLVLNNSK